MTEYAKSTDAQAFVSDKQLAARYGVNRTAIWRWLKNGDFPAPVRLSPGCTRWRLADVYDYERKCGAA